MSTLQLNADGAAVRAAAGNTVTARAEPRIKLRELPPHHTDDVTARVELAQQCAASWCAAASRAGLVYYSAMQADVLRRAEQGSCTTPEEASALAHASASAHAQLELAAVDDAAKAEMAASTAAALAVPACEVAVTGARAGSVVVDMRVNAADAGAAARLADALADPNLPPLVDRAKYGPAEVSGIRVGGGGDGDAATEDAAADESVADSAPATDGGLSDGSDPREAAAVDGGPSDDAAADGGLSDDSDPREAVAPDRADAGEELQSRLRRRRMWEEDGADAGDSFAPSEGTEQALTSDAGATDELRSLLMKRRMWEGGVSTSHLVEAKDDAAVDDAAVDHDDGGLFD